MWPNTVDEDYDEKTSYKTTKAVILGALRDNPILHTKFFLLQEIFPAAYSQLPPEKELLELYVQFKENLTTKAKKEKVKAFLDNL